MNENKKKSSKPITTTLLIFGLLLMIAGGIMFAIGLTNYNYPGLLIAGVLSFQLGLVLFIYGISPYTLKIKSKIDKESIDYAKEDVGDVASTTADTLSPATTKLAKAIKEGLGNDDPQIFCKHCGNSIDADSKFCNKCGKEQ